MEIVGRHTSSPAEHLSRLTILSIRHKSELNGTRIHHHLNLPNTKHPSNNNMSDPRVNQDAIPANEPISARIPHENANSEVDAGGHNKVRTQPESESVPEGAAKVLPPGASIPSGAVSINPEKDAAQRTADSVGSTAVGGSAESTLQGATSADVTTSMGGIPGGVSSKEAHHVGHASTDDQKL
jgi:hypothetical protein